MPWRNIMRAAIAAASVRRAAGNIPSGPTGKGHDRTWRNSAKARNSAARSSRIKANRKARRAGKGV